MARNNPKPTDKTEWDATGNINSPSAGRKTSGWLFSVKPPAEMFNWFWNLTGLNQVYHNAQVQDWIVIDSDADEGDYATLTAYLADAPAAGNRVLIKEDQTVTVQTVIPDDITLKFLDGSRLFCATNIATSVLQFGSDIVVEGVLNVVLSQTGVTAKAVELNGDNVVGKINVENSSTGTLTTGYHINASKTGNQITGFIDNTGGGTLTNVLVDNSTEDSNILIIVDEPNNQPVRSRGAFKFRNGLEFDLGSDADGDIYYRDAGIVKRLSKGSDGEVLSLSGGIPSWGAVITLKKIIDIGPWDMVANPSIAVLHGLSFSKILGVSGAIRGDSSNTRFPITHAGGLTLPSTPVEVWFSDWDSTDIAINRRTGGSFDSIVYDKIEEDIDNAAAVDKGSGLVGIPITGHTFIADDVTTITLTTNYNGTHTIISQTANEIVIAATYISEVFAGTEKASFSRGRLVVEYLP